MGIKNTKFVFSIFSDVSSDDEVIEYVEEYSSDYEFYSFDTLFLGTKIKHKRTSCSCLNR